MNCFDKFNVIWKKASDTIKRNNIEHNITKISKSWGKKSTQKRAFNAFMYE